jgi:hypothetical protein
VSRTTDQLRGLWAPPCEGAKTTMTLFGGGRVTVDNRIMQGVSALDAVLRKWNYQTRAADTGAYNCRQITGGSNWSLHAYGIALDLNWQTNPYGPVLITDMPQGMVNEICAIRTNNGVNVWRWGGNYSGNKDAMHYEVVASPAEMATGIGAGGGGGTGPTPPPDSGDFDLSQQQYDSIMKRLDQLESEVQSVGSGQNKHIELSSDIKKDVLNSRARLVRSADGVYFVVTPEGRWRIENSGQFSVKNMIDWLTVVGLIAPGDSVKADDDYLHGVPKLADPGKVPST